MRHKNRVRRMAAAAILLLLLSGLLSAGAAASEAAAVPPEEGQALIIQVVEDIPACEIQENQVPLAAYPDTPARSGVRHSALMALVLAAVVGYVIYFHRYENRLFRLRQDAAMAERRAAERGFGEAGR